MKRANLTCRLIELLFVGSSLLFVKPGTASDLFPIYPSIEPNVRFWIEAYTKYPTTSGIVHDADDLHIIYEVIQLWHPDRPGARKINRKRIGNAKKKYKKILEKLAHKGPGSDPEARRVAALFGEKGDPVTFGKAMGNIRCQIGQKDRFRKGLVRSGAYIEEIKAIFRSEGLPEDLAYLPHVESSFNLGAESKFGAAGIWQFTRSTGKRFMTVDYALDERRDPIRSSRAAAKLLARNYERLGSWPLAITAYNHGVPGILRAKRAKGSYEAMFKHYRSRLFKFASRNFYSEFLAAMEVAKNYERYFGPLRLDKPAETKKVVMDGYAPVKDLSRCFGVEIDTIRRLNPALREPVFKGQKFVPKGYALRLPADAVEDVLLASVKMLEDIYRPGQKRSRFYRVKRGDTVSEIAMRHGLRPSDLILANNLDSRGTVYINQNLRLPLPEEALDLAPTGRDTSAQLASEDRPRPSAVRDMIPQDSPPIFEGRISASEFAVNRDVVAGNLEVQRVMVDKGNRIGIIRVEIEETLGHYADWLGIPTQEIRRLNGLPYGKMIRLHQEVKIPLDRVSRDQFEEARYEYHKEIQEDFFTAYKVEALQIYRAKNGDNIWTLCREVFKIPFWLLRMYNPQVNFNDLRWSQRLAIPVVEKRVEAGSGAMVL